MKKNIKGFTLIELLVVVAIVGILTAIVMISLGNAKKKGDDGAFKKEVNSMQPALILTCDSGNLVAATDLAANGQRGLGTVNVQTCGTGSSNTFNVTVPVKSNFGGNCTQAVITEKSITFTGC